MHTSPPLLLNVKVTGICTQINIAVSVVIDFNLFVAIQFENFQYIPAFFSSV